MNVKRMLATFLLGAIICGMAGCEDSLNAQYTKPVQMNSGIVYILPGIQGVDDHYKHIRNGLVSAGLRCAIKIHPWGCQFPGLNLMVNETDTKSDREWGHTIAKEIVEYQREYPGRPVYIIGQSGGAAVAVFTAEALSTIPGAQQINGVVMLDASLSSDYNMSRALSSCSEGIVNFYYPKDVALLVVGTELFGNLDGGHGASAGQAGIYGTYPKLYQVKIVKDMVDDFSDPHFADCTTAFATQYIAPWIFDKLWPPSHLNFSRNAISAPAP